MYLFLFFLSSLGEYLEFPKRYTLHNQTNRFGRSSWTWLVVNLKHRINITSKIKPSKFWTKWQLLSKCRWKKVLGKAWNAKEILEILEGRKFWRKFQSNKKDEEGTFPLNVIGIYVKGSFCVEKGVHRRTKDLSIVVNKKSGKIFGFLHIVDADTKCPHLLLNDFVTLCLS